MNKLLFKDESYKIIGSAISVHKELGLGFFEAVYQEALEIEFQTNNIPYKREVELPIFYKGRELNKKYIVDFICYDKIIVEIKAMSKIIPEFKAQTINYLKASKMELGLLINFGETSLKYERLIRLHSYKLDDC